MSPRRQRPPGTTSSTWTWKLPTNTCLHRAKVRGSSFQWDMHKSPRENIDSRYESPPIQCSSCALAPPSSSHLARRGRDSHLHTMRRRAVTCHVSHISRLPAPSQVLKDLHWIPHPASAPAEGISTQESCVMSLCSSLALKHSAGSIWSFWPLSFPSVDTPVIFRLIIERVWSWSRCCIIARCHHGVGCHKLFYLLNIVLHVTDEWEKDLEAFR